jgi:hypothetical protein
MTVRRHAVLIIQKLSNLGYILAQEHVDLLDLRMPSQQSNCSLEMFEASMAAKPEE